MPFINPFTVIGLVVPVATCTPAEYTVYNVIALPPLDCGGLKLTIARVSPLIALTPVGAPGTVAVGITALEAADGALDPAAFVAVTVKV